MRNIQKILAAILLITLHTVSWAVSDERLFYSELLVHESRQVLDPDRVISYEDKDYGSDLRKLLDQNRAEIILTSYANGQKTNNWPADLDLKSSISHLVARYEAAFLKNPKKYELEYLDSYNFFIGILNPYPRMNKNLPTKKTSAPSPELERLFKSPEMKRLFENIQKMASNFNKILVENLQEKIDKEMFSEAGKSRAKKYIELINQDPYLNIK